MHQDVSSLLNTGDIPNLFAPEDWELMVDMLKGPAKEAGRDLGKESLMNFFVERAKLHLHIVLCMSPIGPTLRIRIRKFPALVNCCTIDWFSPWPSEALQSVAKHFLNTVTGIEDHLWEALVECCQFMHESVRDTCAEYYAQQQQHVYVTPTLFLELISILRNLLRAKTDEITNSKRRYDVGLEQLQATERDVELMTATMESLKPNLRSHTPGPWPPPCPPAPAPAPAPPTPGPAPGPTEVLEWPYTKGGGAVTPPSPTPSRPK